MKEVVCWCCENYKLVDLYDTDWGFCVHKNSELSGYDRVCEEFIMRRGLYTKRTVPDYCRNYKNE